MKKQAFMDESKSVTAKRKKELGALAHRIEKARKNPDFLAYLDKRIAKYDLK